MNRYAKIEIKMPREFLLLQGTGCFHKECRFCNYHGDISDDPYAVNKPIIESIMGIYGVIDVINSGSINELDDKSFDLLAKVVVEKKIHTIWFETHYHYKDNLDEIRAKFPTANVFFRTGIESFDNDFRVQMNKGVPDISPKEIRDYFAGVCLLVCIEGQSKEKIMNDIEIASTTFDYFSVNVFCPNSTDVKRDEELYKWFVEDYYPNIKNIPNGEILIGNTDLGVG